MKSVATIIHGKDKDKTLLAAIEHHRYILIRCLANRPGAAPGKQLMLPIWHATLGLGHFKKAILCGLDFQIISLSTHL